MYFPEYLGNGGTNFQSRNFWENVFPETNWHLQAQLVQLPQSYSPNIAEMPDLARDYGETAQVLDYTELATLNARQPHKQIMTMQHAYCYWSYVLGATRTEEEKQLALIKESERGVWHLRRR